MRITVGEKGRAEETPEVIELVRQREAILALEREFRDLVRYKIRLLYVQQLLRESHVETAKHELEKVLQAWPSS